MPSRQQQRQQTATREVRSGAEDGPGEKKWSRAAQRAAGATGYLAPSCSRNGRAKDPSRHAGRIVRSPVIKPGLTGWLPIV